MDRREHHRAQLRLPVRLRWTTPFGQKTEVCETLDASRGGLLVPCREEHTQGVPLWITFPYDSSLGDAQPEVLATVVRTAAANGDGAGNAKSSAPDQHARNANRIQQAVAVHFEIAHPQANGNGNKIRRERRASPRRPLATPVRVRPGNIPWFEEAMTMDVSADGLRFVSNREYRTGEHLFISFEPSAAAPWAGTKEFWSRVVHIEPAPQGTALAVSVSRLP
jgi:PilZ domain